MQTKLIAITKPVEDSIKDMTPEELTAYVARVSNPSNQMNNESAPKLLAYCIKNQHWSVFEHVHMTVEIKTSRAIAAQILRHRSFVFQEHSQRYAEVNEFEVYEARAQDIKNRQNSLDNMSEDDKEWFRKAQDSHNANSMELYKEALSRGVAKEQSRFLLPLSTQTTLFMTGNIRSWLHYVDLRATPATQKEHRDIAQGIKDIMATELPTIAKAKGWIE